MKALKYSITIVNDYNKKKEDNAVRLMLLSDTHVILDQIEFDNLPNVDIVLHAGDFSNVGEKKMVQDFLEKYKQVNAKYKVFIAGNHEKTLDPNHENYNKEIRDLVLNEKDLIYLENSSVNLLGLNIFGSPYSPEFYNWGFPTPKNADKIYQEKITNDTDIVLIHGPPYGILDKTVEGILTGCKHLLKRVKEVKPGLVVFGHIHEAYGIKTEKKIMFVNASNSDFSYNFTQKPIIVDFIKKK